MSNGSYDGEGGGRLRPVLVRGFPVVGIPHAHVVLANVTSQGPSAANPRVVEASSQGPSGHQGGGAQAVPSVQSVVAPPRSVGGKF